MARRRAGLLRGGHQPPPVCRPAVRGAFRRFVPSRAREHAGRTVSGRYIRRDPRDECAAPRRPHRAGRREHCAHAEARRPTALVEPYCATEEAKAAFGRAQIEAGISEQTYLLHQWHRAFVDAGLRLHLMRVSDSFCRSMRRLTARIAICSPDSTTVDFQFSTRPLRLRRRPSSEWSLRSRIAATPYGAQSASSLSMRATILAAGAPTVTCLSPSTICARASRRRSNRAARNAVSRADRTERTGQVRRRNRPGSRVCHVVRSEGTRAARRDVPGVRRTTLTAEPPSLSCFPVECVFARGTE